MEDAITMVRAAGGEDATASPSPETLDRGQVVALLELLREAVIRGRFVAIDATLHGLCGGKGVNAAGLRWASERIAEDLVDPAGAAARVALAVLARPPEHPTDPSGARTPC